MSRTKTPADLGWESDTWRQVGNCTVWLAVAAALAGWIGVGIFVALITHEVGHLVAARWSGAKTFGIACHPTGMVTRIYADYTPALGARLAIAGPLTGVVLALIALATTAITHQSGLLAYAYISACINILVLMPYGETDGVRVVAGVTHSPKAKLRSSVVAALLYTSVIAASVMAAPLIGIGFGIMVITMLVRYGLQSSEFEHTRHISARSRLFYGGLYLLTAVVAAVVIRTSLELGSAAAVTAILGSHWLGLVELVTH